MFRERQDLPGDAVAETENRKPNRRKPRSEQFNPRTIKAFLDQYVVGQEKAKMAMSVAVYNHYRRIGEISGQAKTAAVTPDIELDKSNMLLVVKPVPVKRFWPGPWPVCWNCLFALPMLRH
jgi:ATP-dependent protease Clp ATPase subunit